MGDCLSALLTSLMSLQLRHVDRNNVRPCFSTCSVIKVIGQRVYNFTRVAMQVRYVGKHFYYSIHTQYGVM